MTLPGSSREPCSVNSPIHPLPTPKWRKSSLVEDCQQDAALIPGAELRIIRSVWGHMSGFCVLDADRQAIDDVLQEILA